MTGEVNDLYLLLGYIMQFANVVELYQKKNCNCFGCRSPDHLVKDYPKELGKAMRKVGLNLKEGTARREADPLRSWWLPNRPPQMMLPSIKTCRKSPFLNPDPLMYWSRSENIAQVKINDEGSWALLDSGSTINAVTPEFIKACPFNVGPLSDLVDGTLKKMGSGDCFPNPWAMSS